MHPIQINIKVHPELSTGLKAKIKENSPDIFDALAKTFKHYYPQAKDCGVIPRIDFADPSETIVGVATPHVIIECHAENKSELLWVKQRLEYALVATFFRFDAKLGGGGSAEARIMMYL